MHPIHRETHLIERIGWLRAAVLGANDGIISTASLVVGVAAAATSSSEVLVAGVAGLVAGAMSMAAGEYVSVSSQADTEAADLARERRELAEAPESELDELTTIYIKRGIDPALARQVAEQLTAKDAFAAHARDELGLSAHVVARPVQAALTSAATFSVGASLPLAIVFLAPAGWTSAVVSGGSLVCLAVLGAVSARVGGAGIWKPTLRVTFWGALAMAASAAIGALVGHAV
ncbi:MAG: VIT family protein [Rhodopseudomonas sp.]|uniref:VIT1/CCC1 transporter family protein n=1 Tax=Rhodopseudomonas sp. TaxID=1078 RepID=UPI00184B3A95|nr:VIT family protein [Rhodopseudomonas sp.]NVN88469.1 VIT family protein [Rhodopseudomonas sp.]